MVKYNFEFEAIDTSGISFNFSAIEKKSMGFPFNE